MNCPTPCDRCGDRVELDDLHFRTKWCESCHGPSLMWSQGFTFSCTHGICDDCLAEVERDDQ